MKLHAPYNLVPFASLLGKTCRAVTLNPDKTELLFDCGTEGRYLLHHIQSCCERVRVEEIVGDLSDLEGSPILQAEESTNQDNPPQYAESFTWTFYRIATAKGQVVIRWLGESNGYYSESVDFTKIA